MLKFEGVKEFDIEELDSKSVLTRNFQIIFSDDMLDEEACEIVEKRIIKHDFSIKNENVCLEVIYNIDLDIAIITMTIHCPMMQSDQILEKTLMKFIETHKTNFKEYHGRIKPY